MSYTRRQFLQTSLGASTMLSFGSAMPAFLGRAALAGAENQGTTDKVLVVVQLSGGNDGLNTVIPYEDDEYARGRPTLRIPGDRVHRIGSDSTGSNLGFHPQMAAFRKLFEDGRLAVVQGVGYPRSSRDHDGAMRDWHTARPGESTCQTGWLGRAIDSVSRPEVPAEPGVFVGDIAAPFAIRAEQTIVPSIRSVEDWALRATSGAEAAKAMRHRLARLAETPRSSENGLLDFLGRTAASAYASSGKVENVVGSPSQGVTSDYPPFPLARTFRTISQLIRADIGIRIYFAEMGGGGIGGFDSHANQAANHGALLAELSQSVAAFVEDLARDRLLDRVLLTTFSEFGRTVAENGRRGTGHGVAAPMFVAGSEVRGGLIGEHPNLTELDGGAQKFHTDMRRVYATLLDEWLGIDSEVVLGGRFGSIGLIKA